MAMWSSRPSRRGQSVAGLSERNEYEWNLDKPKLDLKSSMPPAGPNNWPAWTKRPSPLFTTDFTREFAEIAWGRGKSKVVIEAALDQGFVVAGKRKEAICELELELREGEPQALLELAAELAASLPLMPCDISKAERGYRLLEPDSYELGLPGAELDAEMAVDDAYAALARQRWAAASAWPSSTATMATAPVAGLGRVPERTARVDRQPGPGRTACRYP